MRERFNRDFKFTLYLDNEVPDFSSYTFLIVEDEPSCYQYLYAALKRANAKVSWVKDGKSAVDFIRENENVDLILMDIKLPIMTGYEAAKQIKNEYPYIPIVAQTAYALVGDKEKCLESGCDGYLPKPFNIASLYEVILEQLNRIMV